MRHWLTALWLLATTLHAQEPIPVQDGPPPAPASIEPSTPAEDPIPRPLPPSRYDSVFGRNPFLIKTPTQTVTGPNFAENYELRAYYSIRGIETAVLKDRQTNKSVKVTSEENKDGLKLTRATPSKRRSEITVEIAKGSESHVFQFPKSAAAAAAAGGSPMGAAGGAPSAGIPRPNPTVPGNLRPTAAGGSSLPGRRITVPSQAGGPTGSPTGQVMGGPVAPVYQNPAQTAPSPTGGANFSVQQQQQQGQPGISAQRNFQQQQLQMQQGQAPGIPGIPGVPGVPLNPVVTDPNSQVPSAVSRRRRILAVPDANGAVPTPTPNP